MCVILSRVMVKMFFSARPEHDMSNLVQIWTVVLERGGLSMPLPPPNPEGG